ncbi:hypothetical protein [Streptomyces sp. NRRL F-5650]|uniref:hypothetical protein n=1 Tax=Streptomyces sp. NRRL F-5650 TaxID=1463868 RepID=UPI00099BB6A7|nr:hypothetical protein [Streptomyces sp. NRRL F-5650]
MHQRTLGRDLRVSAIGFGAMGMSHGYGPNPGDRDDMIAVLRGAADRGQEQRASQAQPREELGQFIGRL